MGCSASAARQTDSAFMGKERAPAPASQGVAAVPTVTAWPAKASAPGKGCLDSAAAQTDQGSPARAGLSTVSAYLGREPVPEPDSVGRAAVAQVMGSSDTPTRLAAWEPSLEGFAPR